MDSDASNQRTVQSTVPLHPLYIASSQVLSAPYIKSLLSDRPQLLRSDAASQEACALELFLMLRESWATGSAAAQ